MVTTNLSWDLRHPTRKLAEQSAGLSNAERVGNAYRLELSESIKVHPIFSPEKLRRATVEWSDCGPQPPITFDGQDEWEVEQIQTMQLIRKKLFYRVKRLGHDDLTWYPAQNFKTSPHRIHDFHVQYPDLAGPPKRLAEWLKATDEDVFLEDHEEDTVPGSFCR
jgi:hypothetical protein